MQKRNNKFLLVILIGMFLLFGCNKKNDAYRIKEEYEKLNSSLIKVQIDLDNPFIISNENNINSLIKSSESFVVFYGNPNNINSRKMIETIINVSKEVGLNKIYYVSTDVSDIKLIGYIDASVSKETSENNNEEIYDLINEVSIKLNTCNIEVGC